MSNVAKVTLSGNLGSDPDFRKTQGGTDVANVSLAVNIYQGADKDDRTDWYQLQLWGGKAEFAEYLSKGDRVMVVGTPIQNQWEGDDGERRFTMQVRVDEIDAISNGDGGSSSSSSSSSSSNDGRQTADEDDVKGDDVDLPF